MLEKTKEILDPFGRARAKLAEQDKTRLYWLGEGLAFQGDRQKADKRPGRPPITRRRKKVGAY